MHRFFFPEQSDAQELTLSGPEGHHAAHVVRVRRHEQVMLLDGKGTERLCEVLDARGEHIRLRLIEKRTVPPLPYQLTLVQAVPKGKLFESIIQKATELGATQIIPLLSERVVVHLDSGDAHAKAEKWQQVAVEAIKQCGAAWLPKVETPQNLREVLAQKTTSELALVGALDGSARHPQTYLQEFRRRHARNPGSVCVWIGPEGDFTSVELETIRSAGAFPITLGPLVLRTETAALYCLSILNYELQAPGP